MGAGTKGKIDKRIQGWREECMKGWREKSIHGCRKEGKNERMKRRRDRSHKWAKRARTIKHRPQNLQKKGTEIDQNGAKIDPKGSQNEAKTDKKSEQRLQDDLGPPWGAISRLSWSSQVPSWVPKSSQIPKKTYAKNHWFFDGSWKRQKWEKGAKNRSKTEPEMVNNRAQEGGPEENGKSVKTNNATRF